MFTLYNITPVAFHPYTSRVMERVFSMEFDSDSDYLRKRLHELFTEAGIKNHPDNKIVFECEAYGKKIYYGF